MRSVDGGWFVRVKAANGLTLMVSAPYRRKRAARRCIDIMKAGAADSATTVID